MGIKNNKLGGTDWVSGEALTYTDLNDTFDASTTSNILGGLNLIRMLQDRSIDFSKGGFDWFGDAYSDSNGRMNSVDTGNTTAIFSTDNLTYGYSITNESSSDTINNDDGFTDPSNAFDDNDSTYAEKILTSQYEDISVELGTTFSAKTIPKVYVNAYYYVADNNNNKTTYIILQTYNGSTWSDYVTLKTVAGYDAVTNRYSGYTDLIGLGDIQGVRVKFSSSGFHGSNQNVTLKLTQLTYGENTESVITHNIPSGSFISTISKSIGVPLLFELPTGSNIQYKLTNDTEDSGWLDYNELTSFTAFTSEATKFIVKLIPNNTTPNNGLLQLLGFAIKGD